MSGPRSLEQGTHIQRAIFDRLAGHRRLGIGDGRNDWRIGRRDNRLDGGGRGVAGPGSLDVAHFSLPPLRLTPLIDGISLVAATWVALVSAKVAIAFILPERYPVNSN